MTKKCIEQGKLNRFDHKITFSSEKRPTTKNKMLKNLR